MTEGIFIAKSMENGQIQANAQVSIHLICGILLNPIEIFGNTEKIWISILIGAIKYNI